MKNQLLILKATLEVRYQSHRNLFRTTLFTSWFSPVTDWQSKWIENTSLNRILITVSSRLIAVDTKWYKFIPSKNFVRGASRCEGQKLQNPTEGFVFLEIELFWKSGSNLWFVIFWQSSWDFCCHPSLPLHSIRPWRNQGRLHTEISSSAFDE